MRFPLRLSADLFKAKVSNLLAGASRVPAILRIAPDENALAHASQTVSPVIWLGGTEPLLHPEIGRVANSLVESNRYTFLHTDGHQLRQRIHEFRPDSRLFLTLEFAGREEAQNYAVGRPDAFRRSIEAIRAAKLSGFLVAAHVTVTRETDACDTGELIEFLDKKDVDGFIVTGGRQLAAENDSALQEVVEESREMIRCGRWENFSRLLDASYRDSVVGAPKKLPASSESAYEEGD